MSEAVTLGRRLATFRAHSAAAPRPSTAALRRSGEASAVLLADAIGGEVVAAPGGRYVRVEADAHPIALDRERLASLPGMPPAEAPLVCLDTETTGLSTGTGTFAFLVGLGSWHDGRFRQVQYLLPDEADEPAMLAAIARQIPADAWLVTYNGRSFDWPLLVARYRLERAAAPDHAGHLDLLPLVRRLFRHRMENARLKTVESSLLGVRRHRDVDGWEIPAFYLDFLRGGPVAPIAEIVRHNDEDVRSLARLLALLDRAYGDREARRSTPRGDLAGLARAFARAGRTLDALACLEDATIARASRPDVTPTRLAGSATAAVEIDAADDPPWWSPRARPDFGGRGPGRVGAPAIRDLAGHRWTDERLAAERARLLARLGRDEEAAAAWRAAAADPGSLGVLAWIEIAKLHAPPNFLSSRGRRSSPCPRPASRSPRRVRTRPLPGRRYRRCGRRCSSTCRSGRKRRRHYHGPTRTGRPGNCGSCGRRARP